MKRRILKHISQRTAMLSGISHDLKTPLTRLKLQIELLNKNQKLNSLKEEGAGFKYDTNKVYLVSTTQTKTLPLLTKQQVAEIIVEETLVIQN